MNPEDIQSVDADGTITIVVTQEITIEQIQSDIADLQQRIDQVQQQLDNAKANLAAKQALLDAATPSQQAAITARIALQQQDVQQVIT